MASVALTGFDQLVAEVIRSIPRGRVLSYGSVAARAGRWQGARHVARALRTLDGVPWWRVIRSDGTLAKEVADRQARRLRAEGVKVQNGRVVNARALRG